MLAAGAAGLAAGVGIQMMNNAFADKAAERSFANQRILMNEQYRMNRENLYENAQLQAQGARMAGFNPAMFMNGGMSPAPTVSQGNADMAQRFPMDVGSMLSVAQLLKTEADIENVKADTNIKKNQAPNVLADTNLKVAQKLYQEASTEVQKQKAQEIRNINQQYADRNNMLKTVGPAMMDQLRTGLQEKGLWDKILPKTRETIADLADGNYELSVGSLVALGDVIKSQNDLSDADRKLVENGLRSAVIYGQLSDKNVLDAMAKEPWYEAELKRVGKDKMLADIEKVRNEVLKIVAETSKVNKEVNYQEMVNKAFEHGDLDYLRGQGKWGEILEKLAVETLKESAPGAVQTILSKVMRTVPTPNHTTNVYMNDKGVGNFKYNKK